MSYRLPLAAALAALIAAPVGAEITYPIPPEQRAGGWAIWLDPDMGGPDPGHVFARDRPWNQADGLEIPLPCSAQTGCYTWLRQVRIEPPEIDSRFQALAYPCPETPDFAADELQTVCTAQVRPEAEIMAAVGNLAEARITESLARIGLRTPSDLVWAIALIQRQAAGQTLATADQAYLDQLGDAGVEYVAQVRAAQEAIGAWVLAHPGEIPAVGEDEWPPLPPLPEAPE